MLWQVETSFTQNNGFQPNNFNTMNNGSQAQTFVQPDGNNANYNSNNLNMQSNQNLYQGNMMMANTVAEGKKKKSPIKIILIAIVAFIALIFLKNLLFGSSKISANKVLTCSTHHAMMGVYYDEIYEFSFYDDGVSIEYITKTDLEKTKIDGDADTWAKQRIDAAKSECSDGSCKFEYEYSKGKELQISTTFENANLSNIIGSTGNMNDEDIYNAIKKKYQNGEIDGSVYTCN